MTRFITKFPKEIEPQIGSLGWRLGTGYLGRKCVNLSPLWKHQQKKTKSKTFYFKKSKLKDFPHL